MRKLVVDNTPWELCDIDGVEVFVKREDLCCPLPGPSFSKIRGVAAHLGKLQPGTPVGVLDTIHSKAGWGVAYICNALALPCYDFYPVYTREHTDCGYQLRTNQQHAKELGAQLMPLSAGMSAVLFNIAKRRLKELTGGIGVMLPNALKLIETYEATATEVIDYTPKKLLCGTWVISISSGTIAAGVIRGLGRLGVNVDVVAHMGYSRSEERIVDYMIESAGCTLANLRIVDEGYEYKDAVDNSWIPFPCNEHYDAKAFTWLHDHVHELKQPIVFWNIGA